MNESQKPFACTIDGCEMTFTNEDHLNWHHKKHDMVLNFGLTNKTSEIADQTPTPTRFIRNCEEVGLFQDLQNVNPFDETFKKAIESVKTGNLLVSKPSTEDNDTLHTPHILPHVVENSNISKYIDARNDQLSHSSEFSIGNVEVVTFQSESDIQNEGSNINTPRSEQNGNICGSYKMMVDTDSDSNGNTQKNGTSKANSAVDLKSKLKQVLKNKEKSKGNVINIEQKAVLAPVSFDNFKPREESSKKKTGVGVDNIDKIRAMNREAQLRCRKRKKIEWKNMVEELESLQAKNHKLLGENLLYKRTFAALKSFILKKREENKANISLTDIEAVLAPSPESVIPNHHNDANRKRRLNQRSVKRKPPPLFAATPLVNQQPVQANAKPFFIQVLGPVEQLAISVLSKQS